MRATRRALLAVFVGLVVAASASAGGPAGAAGSPAKPVAERAYTVEAEAYPTEPAPGSQDEPVSVRPNSTRIQLVNPPADAYARAAQSDLGLAEGYLGPQGQNAEADTTAPNSSRDVTVEEDGVHLEARVSEAPTAEALAEGSIGGPSGTGRSRSFGDGSQGVLVAEASAEVQDVLVGPLLVGQGRFDARVQIDGTPGGASAEGSIVMTQTSVNGIPVVVGADGVTVDESQIPASQVPTATAAVQETFSQGGYSDIRIVQPRTTVADDGTRAEVSGGGVYMNFTNNDPSNRYFLRYTMLGGRAFAALGTSFEVVGAPSPPDAPPARPGPTPSSPPLDTGTGTAGPARPASPVETAAAEPADDAAPAALVYLDDTDTVGLRTIWPYWPWVLGAGAVVVLGSALALRNEALRVRLEALADGYLRG